MLLVPASRSHTAQYMEFNADSCLMVLDVLYFSSHPRGRLGCQTSVLVPTRAGRDRLVPSGLPPAHTVLTKCCHML